MNTRVNHTMANFTPKTDWTLPEDAVWWDVPKKLPHLCKGLCFASNKTARTYYLKVNLPVEEEDAVIQLYLDALKSIGVLSFALTYGIIQRDDLVECEKRYGAGYTDTVAIPANQKFVYFSPIGTDEYEDNSRTLLLGTLLRGIGCYPHVAINFYEMMGYGLNVDPYKLFLLSWGNVYVDGVPTGYGSSPYKMGAHYPGSWEYFPYIAKHCRAFDPNVDVERPLFKNFIHRYECLWLEPKQITKSFVEEFFNE